MAPSARHEERLRELLKLPANKRCADCGTLGTQCAVMHYNVFVCMQCSGVHRQFGHRVKGVSMSSFRPEEVAALEECGNAAFAEAFLARYQGTPSRPVDRSQPRVGEWIRAVYEERRFLDPSKLKPCQTGEAAARDAGGVGALGAVGGAPGGPGLAVAVDEGSLAPAHPGAVAPGAMGTMGAPGSASSAASASTASQLPSPAGPFSSLSSLPPGLAGSHGSFAAMHQYGSFTQQPSGTFAPSPSLQAGAGYPGSSGPSFASAGSAPSGFGAAGSASFSGANGPTGFGNGAMPKPKSRASLQSMAHKASKMTKSAFGVSSKKSFKSAGHLDGFGPDNYGDHQGGAGGAGGAAAGAYAQGAPSPSGPSASGFSNGGTMVGFGSGGVGPQGGASGGNRFMAGIKGGSFGSKRNSGSFNHGSYQGAYAQGDERMSARERQDLDAAIAASLVTAGMTGPAGPDAARHYASDPFSAPSFSRRPASAEAALAPAQAPPQAPAPEPVKKITSVDDIPIIDLLGDSFTAPSPPVLSGAGSPVVALSPVQSFSPAASAPAPTPAVAAAASAPAPTPAVAATAPAPTPAVAAAAPAPTPAVAASAPAPTPAVATDGWADFGATPAAVVSPASPPPAPTPAATPASPPAGWDSFDGPAQAAAAARATSPAAAAKASLPAVAPAPAAATPPKPPVRREPVPLDVFFPEFEQIRATGMLPNGQPVPRAGAPLSPASGGAPAWTPAASGIAATATKGLVPGLSPPVVGGSVRANGAPQGYGAASAPAPLHVSSSAGALNTFPGAMQAALPSPGQAAAYGYGSPSGASSGAHVTFASPVSSTGYSMGSPASPPAKPAPAQAQQVAGLGSFAGLGGFDAHATTSPTLASGNPFA